jgi:hypothetical protein
MSTDKTIRRVTDRSEQNLETYRYWQSRSIAERIAALTEIVRDSYFSKGIDLDIRPSDKTLVRIARPDWKATQ